MSRRATWIGAIGVAGAAVVLAFRKIGDFDLPWHLATGRYLFESGIPEVDPFSSTHPAIGHIDLFADSLLYAIYAGLGDFGLQFARAVIAAGIAVLVYRFSRRAGALAWFCVALALAAMNAWLLVRPATLGFLFTATTLFAIDAHARAPGTRRGRITLALVVPLALLWANSHGSVALGLLIAGGYALYRLACRVAGGRLGAFLPAGDGTDAWVPLGVAVGTVLISGLNMAGYGYLAAGQTPELASLFAEWATPTLEFLFVTNPATGLIVVVSVAALAFGRSAGGSRMPNALEIGLIAVGMFLALSAVRLIAFASILFAYAISRRLAFAADTGRRAGILGLVTVLLLGPVFLASPHSEVGVGFTASHFPSGAVAYIRRAKPTGPIYNFLPFGGYLLWQLYPDHEVLVDGRTGWVYPAQHVLDATRADRDDEAFARLDAAHQFQIAVVRSREGERLGGTLYRSGDWAMVYFDDVGAVYVKRDGPNAELAAAGYQWYRHQSPAAPLLAKAMAGSEAIARDGALAARQAPSSPRAAFLSGCGGIAARDRAVFEAARARLARLVGKGHGGVELLDSAWKDLGPDI